MFHFLNSFGTWLSSACALGFAAFWGWSSVFVDPKAVADSRLFGQAGILLLLGIGLGVLFVGLNVLFAMMRREKVAEQAPVAKAEAQPAKDDFDPDAIIARHLALRAQAPRQMPSVRPVDRFHSRTPVRSFGRKLA